MTPQKTALATKIYRGATGPLRLMPDFIIVGAQKAGTTSLYNYLTRHPSVVPAQKKEVLFFGGPGFGKGRIWYRAHFPLWAHRFYATKLCGEDFLTGEASPYYLFYPLAPRRAAEVVPNAKIVVLLRNPVDRALSHYHYEVSRGAETLSFEEALEREPDRLAGERERMIRDGDYYSFAYFHHSYISKGVYVDQLTAWREFFPKERLLVLKSEDLFDDPGSVVEETLQFLGIPSDHAPEEYGALNEGGYGGMDPALRERLAAYFRPHNRRLYEYLGRDFGWDG